MAAAANCPAQTLENAFESPDTFTVGIQEFLYLLEQYHPVLRRAELLPQEARRSLQHARGAFDPVAMAAFRNKVFKGTPYYDDLYSVLKIPTLVGVEVVGGFERVTGPFSGLENRTGTEGLMFAGLELPIGGSLIFDERRNDLRQAQLLPAMAEAERTKLVNKVLFEALKAYYEWQRAYFVYSLALNGVQLASVRAQAVKARAQAGDLAEVDTVEAVLEVQRRQLSAQEAAIELVLAQQDLANFLWTPEGQPLGLPAAAIPAPPPINPSELPPAEAEALVLLADSTHPELLKLRLKRWQLDYEQRFQRWQLVPNLQVSYRPLLQPNAEISGLNAAYLQENYKFGLGFYMPVLMRKQRAKFEVTKLKISVLELETAHAQLQVGTAVQAQFSRTNLLAELWRGQEQAAALASTLLRAEQTRFEVGESTLFLVNTRERTLLEAQQKLLDMQAKWLKTRAELAFTAGQNPLESLPGQ